MGRLTPLKIWQDQRRVLPRIEADLTGRTVMVVGSSTGIGLEAARRFAELKADRLILADLSPEKGEAAKANIVETTGIADSAVEVWLIDYTSFASVQAFAQRAHKELARIDVLLLNAGISLMSWSRTGDGYESMLQVNCISPGLLAKLLRPLVRQAAKSPFPSSETEVFKPHITFTCSDGHYLAHFPESSDPHPIEALERSYGSTSGIFDRYNTTKLLQVFMAREIAGLAGEDVVVNTVNPGLCRSELFKDLPLFVRPVIAFFNLAIGRTCEVGSRAVVWSALTATPSGAYTSHCQVEEEADSALGDKGSEIQRRLWADLMEIWTRVAPETGPL